MKIESITPMSKDVSAWANPEESKFKLVIYFLDGNSMAVYSRVKLDKRNLQLSKIQLIKYWLKENKNIHFKDRIKAAILYCMITGEELEKFIY